MTALTLRLIPSPTSAAGTAGFLPGSDTAAWLEEMARHPGARCFAVPTSAADPDPAGLLLFSGPEASARFSQRVVPCVVEYEKVAVPCGHRLDPALTEEEARRLLIYPAYFFHPVLGLVAFEPQDAVTAASLIVPPLMRTGTWTHAIAGPLPPPPLTRVSLLLSDDPGSFFGDSAQDIASQSPDQWRRRQPPLTRLAGTGLDAAAGMARWFLRLFNRALTQNPGAAPPQHPATRGTFRSPPLNPSRPVAPWRRKFDRWTARQAEKLETFRHREIDRLLRLLESDPEAGLRHAIPLDGGDTPRGIAEPSWQLTPRNPIFRSRQGGGPADVWQLPDATRARLHQKYRDLANREIATGRFERAAYIFAELLGDWHAAAGALARAGRHQEAARVFLEKLGNKAQAAACLEQGGLIADAITLFSELGQHEKCGDLWLRLSSPTEANAAYRRALQGTGDRLHDARILFDKLKQPDLALRVLASGYPGSGQACQCLERQFEYLRRLDDREASLALARSLTRPENRLSDDSMMVWTLRSIHRSQSCPALRESLATLSIELIGHHLTERGPASKALVELLPDFAPGDSVLPRDVQRFGVTAHQSVERLTPKSASRSPGSASRLRELKVRDRTDLPHRGTRWSRLHAQDDTWVAVGHHARHQWIWALGRGTQLIGSLTCHAGATPGDAMPVHLPACSETIWLPFIGDGGAVRYGEVSREEFAAGSASISNFVNRLSWLPAGVLAVASQTTGLWVAHDIGGDTVELSVYLPDGTLVRSHSLPKADFPEWEAGRWLAVHGVTVAFATGRCLALIRNGHVVAREEFDSPIRRLLATKLVQPAAFLVHTTNGAWHVTPSEPAGMTVRRLDPPPSNLDQATLATLLDNGDIVVGGPRSCWVCRSNASLSPNAEARHSPPTHASLPTVVDIAGTERQFGALTAHGRIEWYG